MDKTTRSILAFILKAFLMSLPILAPAVAFYILADPFKALTTDTSSYYPDYRTHHARVGINKGMVSVRNLEQQIRDGHTYNAFIFGSSVSCYYDARQWAQIIARDSRDTIRPYHFDSSSESLQQMAEKVRYLQDKGIRIRHALIVLDPIIMASETDNSPMSITPPETTGTLTQLLRFHYTFFRAATNADFLKSWIPGTLADTPSLIGRNPVFEPQPICYDPAINQESIPQWDSIIATDPRHFYAEHPLITPPAHPTQSQRTLTPEKIEALRDIARIFRSQATDYRVIIGPNRRKVTLNPDDLATLNSIFGTGKVRDYTRTNIRDLETDTLLYDNTHYRPAYALRLLRLTYP